MNISKYIKTFAVGALIAPFIAGCDSVDEKDRFIEMPPVESDRVVLLEDFTGQMCTNCPDAHAVMELLSEQYKEKLICVSIHAGSFGLQQGVFGGAEGTGGMTGLMIKEGDELAKKAGVESYPAGVIDGGPVTDYNSWATVVDNAFKVPSTAVIEGTAVLEENKIKVTAMVEAGAQINGKISLWVLEDNIVAMQSVHGNTKMDYIHDHVFRGAIGELFGNDINVGHGEQKSVEYSTEVLSYWNTSNLSVVVFVSDGKGAVLQAALFPVTAE